MRTIRICDQTVALPFNGRELTFKEKLDIVKLLDRLNVPIIELGVLSDAVADTLLVKSVASAVTKSTVSVSVIPGSKSLEAFSAALQKAPGARLCVCAGLSPARMEYVYHRKAADMKAAIVQTVAEAAALGLAVDFFAEDATSADPDFLVDVLKSALDAGASTVTVGDTAGQLLPNELEAFVASLQNSIASEKLGICCSSLLNLADASAIAALHSGLSEVRTAVQPSQSASLNHVVKLIDLKKDEYGITCPVRLTELDCRVEEILKIGLEENSSASPFDDGVRENTAEMSFSSGDSKEDVLKAVESLGYYLDENSQIRVWNAFRELAAKKEKVNVRELEMIIASETVDVPSIYSLEHFVVTTGNAIDITAHVKLKKDGKVLDGLSLGDGPIDAAFLAIEKITGHHYELDDFQIQAISEGREAMGQTLVKLRYDGKVYAGRGVSTDIIGSGIMAYLNALNKIESEG